MRASTFGELKKIGYKTKSIKQELRDNLIKKIEKNEKTFEGILGFDQTVIPDLERAILSRHNVLLLGLRGQAKTRIARLMTQLLDEYIPYISGTELNDDPFGPISKEGIDILEKDGDGASISWLHRDERYVEKLATPDVSVADLIGDVDPIKAATLKLPYSDERVLHFGLVPRSHRSIFVINELPDLQARIQVSLFNILQEGDLQIRGFKLRLPLDIQFVFTANPEDYTNRGSIITPLKDRIESQILTHYPMTLEIAKEITKLESRIHAEQEKVSVPDLHATLLEAMVFKARDSEYIDEKSGVSARLSISAMENLVSTAERRLLINGESYTDTRISDFWGVIPAVTGKIELVYEGEQEGSYSIAIKLLSSAIKDVFLSYFPNPDKLADPEGRDPYGVIKSWFSAGNTVEILTDASEVDFQNALNGVAGLRSLVSEYGVSESLSYFFMELVLHGLNEFEVVGRSLMNNAVSFEDPLASMFEDDFDV